MCTFKSFENDVGLKELLRIFNYEKHALIVDMNYICRFLFQELFGLLNIKEMVVNILVHSQQYIPFFTNSLILVILYFYECAGFIILSKQRNSNGLNSYTCPLGQYMLLSSFIYLFIYLFSTYDIFPYLLFESLSRDVNVISSLSKYCLFTVAT